MTQKYIKIGKYVFSIENIIYVENIAETEDAVVHFIGGDGVALNSTEASQLMKIMKYIGWYDVAQMEARTGKA